MYFSNCCFNRFTLFPICFVKPSKSLGLMKAPRRSICLAFLRGFPSEVAASSYSSGERKKQNNADPGRVRRVKGQSIISFNLRQSLSRAIAAARFGVAVACIWAQIIRVCSDSRSRDFGLRVASGNSRAHSGGRHGFT